MSVVHFDPYHSEEVPEQAMCGTVGIWAGDTNENEFLTDNSWNFVTCKRCLKQKRKLTKIAELIEKDIIKGMGEFVEFCKEEA
jgi:hypothetical protein